MKNAIISTNRKYLLMLCIFCLVIPHGVLCLLQMDSVAAAMSPVRRESDSNFFVCQWIPFWLTFLSYLRLQKTDTVSLLTAVWASVILLTYLPCFPQRSVMAMALTIPLILTGELSALLKKAEASRNKALAAIAADRSLLRAFCFWSLVFPCVIHISCKACTFSNAVVSPFQMLPLPGILLFAVFRQQKEQPPAFWSILGMLALVPMSLFLVTFGPMAQFKGYHLMCLATGFALLFLMLIVYNFDRWKT